MPETKPNQPKKFLRLRRRWNGPGHESAQWPAPRPPVTDPKEIVRSNLEHDRRGGRFDVAPVRRRWSRRVLDFSLLAVAGNGAGVGFLWWSEANTPTVLLVGAGMIFYTFAISWVMFVQHDEY